LLRFFHLTRASLVADEGDDGDPRFRVAHEALLTHWPRARDLITQDREGLRVRAAVEAVEAAWRAADATDRRANLLRDPLLTNANDLARRWGDELALEQREFIARSVAAARTAIRRRWIVAASVMLVLAVLAVASVGALTIAEQQRNGALIAQSRFLARDARAATDHGDATLGQLLALEALLRDLVHPDRPFVIDAEGALLDAMANRHERAVLLGHEGPVRAGAFSPDSKVLAIASDDHSARLWNAATGTAATVLLGHEAEVTAVAFSPDGKRIVTGSRDRTARLWDVETGAQLAVLKGHEGSVLCVAFSPDGQRIATASEDNTAQLWDAASGMPVGTLSGHQDAVRMTQFSPDGKQLLTASGDGTARLWNAETGEPLAVEHGHEAVVNSAVFSTDGTAIVSASNDTTARIWDATTAAERAIMRGHQDMVYAAVFFA
jgi:dipeptidyl aminopeptidase/acylaminoacyl peptidase